MTGAVITIVVSLVGTGLGIYDTYIEPFSSSFKKSRWIGTLTVVCGGLLVLAAVIYVFGPRSGMRQSEDELLASLIGERAPA